jgi:hypothetical protein
MLCPSISDMMLTTTVALARLTRFALDQPPPDDLATIVATLCEYKNQAAESGVTTTADENARLRDSLDILAQSCDDVTRLLITKNLVQDATDERRASAQSRRIELIRELRGLAREILTLLEAEPSRS